MSCAISWTVKLAPVRSARNTVALKAYSIVVESISCSIPRYMDMFIYIYTKSIGLFCSNRAQPAIDTLQKQNSLKVLFALSKPVNGLAS